MTLEKRINAFCLLGERMIAELTPGNGATLGSAVEHAHIHNPWFTPENVRRAVSAVAQRWLNRGTLTEWLGHYPDSRLNTQLPKTIGVTLAGNIPLVGFHDLMCVLLSGHRFQGKLSSKDGHLMLAVAQLLTEIEPQLAGYISITEGRLKGFDAVIATGSDNAARYFDYYFKGYPSIIRKHRNSVAIVRGDETPADFEQLGDDIFCYFGLGCRNVSKLLVPKGYNFTPMLNSFAKWGYLTNHNKYANNYEYNRAIYTMSQVAHLDTGYLLVTPSEAMESPVGVLFYQEYGTLADAVQYANRNREHIQCIVGKGGTHPEAIPFGTTQQPGANDYADGVDTMAFLLGL